GLNEFGHAVEDFFQPLGQCTIAGADTTADHVLYFLTIAFNNAEPSNAGAGINAKNNHGRCLLLGGFRGWLRPASSAGVSCHCRPLSLLVTCTLRQCCGSTTCRQGDTSICA